MSSNTSGKKRFSGWGRTASSFSVPREYANEIEAIDLVKNLSAAMLSANSPNRGAIVRGLGRAYGAAAQNAGGEVLLHRNLISENHSGECAVMPDVDGLIEIDASVSLDALLKVIIPMGWFVPVTPGTRFVTLGGAVASDIHGKNHHCDGSIGNHIVSMQLLTANGEIREVSPILSPHIFWATVGGMGLTGIVLSVRLRLIPIESGGMKVETERVENLDALTSAMRERDHEFRYSVAWIDMLSTGSALGRGILMRGDHASAADAGGKKSLDSYDAKVRLTAPPLPIGLLNKYTVKAFNEAWFRKAPRDRHVGIESIASFFHPLDAVKSWNRLYGPSGFIQYQFVIPLEAGATLRAIVERFAQSGTASFLAVLKLFGAGNSAPLSFPEPGWTLAIDIPASAGLSDFLSEIDALVIDAGGRHYLAKDSHITRQVFEAGYPRLAEWKSTKNEIDPDGLWVSDLGRRLGLS